MKLDWTRVASDDANTTRYVARTDESAYVIVGRDVPVASVRGAVIARRFQAYELDTAAAVGTERARLSEAKAEVADYLDDVLDAGRNCIPQLTDSGDEELMEAALGFDPAPVNLDPTAAVPVTVEQAMTTLLTVARKLDTNGATAMRLDDLAHLAGCLSQAVGARAAVLSSQVVAEQHAERAERERTSRASAVARASADTVAQARKASQDAWSRLASAIVTFDPR